MDKVTVPVRLSQCVQLSAVTNTSLGFQKSKVIAWMSNLTQKEMQWDRSTALQTVCRRIIVKLKDNI